MMCLTRKGKRGGVVITVLLVLSALTLLSASARADTVTSGVNILGNIGDMCILDENCAEGYCINGICDYPHLYTARDTYGQNSIVTILGYNFTNSSMVILNILNATLEPVVSYPKTLPLDNNSDFEDRWYVLMNSTGNYTIIATGINGSMGSWNKTITIVEFVCGDGYCKGVNETPRTCDRDCRPRSSGGKKESEPPANDSMNETDEDEQGDTDDDRFRRVSKTASTFDIEGNNAPGGEAPEDNTLQEDDDQGFIPTITGSAIGRIIQGTSTIIMLVILLFIITTTSLIHVSHKKKLVKQVDEKHKELKKDIIGRLKTAHSRRKK